MKVLAFNGSPRMDKGNTALILNPFLEGMREAGAEVELFYIKKLEVNPCQGCYTCWLKTPGKCVQKDDMQMLYPKLREADIWVFANPVYSGVGPGPVQNLLDRMMPFFVPIFELIDGHCSGVPHEGTKTGKIALVSSCAYWEMDNFDLLLAGMKDFCGEIRREFAGALLRPHGDALRPMIERGEPLDDILEAAKSAGRQLVQDGKISPETLNIVSRELMPLETYVQWYNQKSQQALDALKK